METGNIIIYKGNFQDRHIVPSCNSVLEQALGNYCSAHVKPWCVFRLCWNGTSWQPAGGTVVWTLAIIVKRKKKVTKSQDGRRWRQVWFRGPRLCRVKRSLCLTAWFQHRCLHWEHNFRGRVFEGVWSHSASWHVLVKHKHLLLIRLGPASWSWSCSSGHCQNP